MREPPYDAPLFTERFKVVTTKRSTFERHHKHRKHPIAYRSADELSLDPSCMWMFTDGSGSGWHASVLVHPTQQVRRLARYLLSNSKSVAAELNGIILGLEHAPSKTGLAIVSDYLWSAYFILGWHKVHNPELHERVRYAQELILRLDPPEVRFYYKPGHNANRHVFSRLNNLADKLCRLQSACDQVSSLEEALALCPPGRQERQPRDPGSNQQAKGTNTNAGPPTRIQRPPASLPRQELGAQARELRRDAALATLHRLPLTNQITVKQFLGELKQHKELWTVVSTMGICDLAAIISGSSASASAEPAPGIP